MPNEPLVFLNWGTALFEVKRYSEANKKLKKAIELEPNNVSAHYLIGMILLEQKEYAEAIKKFKKTIELEPNDATAYFFGLIAFLV